MNGRFAWLYWLGGIVIAAVVLTGYFHSGSARGSGPTAFVGQPVQNYPLRTLAGAPDSPDRYRGRIVVLNLWATYCPPCRAEMPDLERLYEAYKDHNVVVLGVDQGDSAQRAGAFARSLGISYPILLDDDLVYGRAYQALGLPTTVVVNAQGEVVRGYDGALSYEQMIAAVKPLVDAK